MIPSEVRISCPQEDFRHGNNGTAGAPEYAPFPERKQDSRLHALPGDYHCGLLIIQLSVVFVAAAIALTVPPGDFTYVA